MKNSFPSIFVKLLLLLSLLLPGIIYASDDVDGSTDSDTTIVQYPTDDDDSDETPETPYSSDGDTVGEL